MYADIKRPRVISAAPRWSTQRILNRPIIPRNGALLEILNGERRHAILVLFRRGSVGQYARYRANVNGRRYGSFPVSEPVSASDVSMWQSAWVQAIGSPPHRNTRHKWAELVDNAIRPPISGTPTIPLIRADALRASGIGSGSYWGRPIASPAKE